MGHLPFDLKTLRHFVAVAQAMGFRKGAELLHMSQPPLTVSIRRMEQALGATLFDRHAGGVSLTPAGAALYELARGVLARAEHAADVVQAIGKGEQGTVRIAFVSSAVVTLLPRVLRRVGARAPGVRPTLIEALSTDIALAVERGEVDIGLLIAPVHLPPELAQECILRDRLVAALPVGHALAGARAVALAALRDESFVSYPASRVPSVHRRIVGACLESGFEPRIVQEAAHVYTLLSLVAGGMGVALVPSAVADMRHAGVRLVPLTSRSALLETAMHAVYTPQALSPAAALFLDAVREVAADLAGGVSP